MKFDEDGNQIVESAPNMSTTTFDVDGNAVPMSRPKESNADRSKRVKKDYSVIHSYDVEKVRKVDAKYSGRIAQEADTYGKQYGVDPNLIKSMIATEANNDVDSTSAAGTSSAQGLGQFTDSSAKAYDVSPRTGVASNVRGTAHYLSDLLKKFNGDTQKAIVGYHDGPSAVSSYVKQAGDNWFSLASPEGVDHLTRLDKYHRIRTGVGVEGFSPVPQTDPAYTLDLNKYSDNNRYQPKITAGMTLDQRNAARDKAMEASALYNNPQAQQAAVTASIDKAMGGTDLREKLGAGVGQFAYELPGVARLAEHVPDPFRASEEYKTWRAANPTASLSDFHGDKFARLAPKGSSLHSKETIEGLEANKTIAQSIGQAIPDVLISTLAGMGASKVAKLPQVLNKLPLKEGGRAIKTLVHTAEGALGGVVSAGLHQLQNLGAERRLSAAQVAVETAMGAVGGAVIGTAADALIAGAPKALKLGRVLRGKFKRGENIDYSSPINEEALGLTEQGTLEKTTAKLSDLATQTDAAAGAASVRPVPPPTPPAPQVPGAAQPMVRPSTPIPPNVLSGSAIEGQGGIHIDVPPRPNSTTTPGLFPVAPEVQAARAQAAQVAQQQQTQAAIAAEQQAREADKARRMAEAAARRNGQYQVVPDAPTPEAPAPTNLSSLASKQAALRPVNSEPPAVRQVKPKTGAEARVETLQQTADEGTIQDAFDAEQALHLQKKLKGQAGNVAVPFGATLDKIRYKLETMRTEPQRAKVAEELAIKRSDSRGEAEAKSFMRAALFNESGHAQVIRDPEGKIIAAINYGISDTSPIHGQKNSMYIASLGGKGGAGKAALNFVHKVASRLKIPVTGQPTSTAEAFYKANGMQKANGVPVGLPNISRFARMHGEDPSISLEAQRAQKTSLRNKPINQTTMDNASLRATSARAKGITPSSSARNEGVRNILENDEDGIFDQAISELEREDLIPSSAEDIDNLSDDETTGMHRAIDERMRRIAEYQYDSVNSTRGQRGAIPNPFAKKPAKVAPAPTVISRKISFVDKTAKSAMDALETEQASPKANQVPSETYGDAKEAISYWKEEAKLRPTTGGGPKSQMTVEDAIGLHQAMKNTLTKERPENAKQLTDGYRKGTKLVMDALEKDIHTQAPEYAALKVRKDKLEAYHKAIENDNLASFAKKNFVQMTPAAVVGVISGLMSEKDNRVNNGLWTAAQVYGISKLATSPGGVRVINRLGKELGKNGVKKTLSAFATSTVNESRKK